MQLVLFEDEYYGNFFPLTLLRPVYELRIGTSSLRERVTRTMGDEASLVLFCRDYLRETEQLVSGRCPVNEVDSIDENVLLINGSLIVDDRVKELITRLPVGKCFTLGDRVVAANIKRSALSDQQLVSALMGTRRVYNAIAPYVHERVELQEARMLRYPWELIEFNSQLLLLELEGFTGREWLGSVDDTVVVYGDKKRVYVGKDASIEAYTVIDVRRGPVFIGDRTHVKSHSRIEGPAYVGSDCVIFGAHVGSGCSIGDVCRIGGEIEATIFHSYSNKRHYGYVGHSYVAEWVNISAGTTISNVKNTYGTIKVYVNGHRHDTGMTFLGAFLGDHVKTAIGTCIFSGKKIGVASHLYGTVLDDVPSFTSYSKTINGKQVEVYLESAVETARRMMARRGLKLSEAHEKLLRKVYEITEEDRRASNVSKGILF